MSVDAMSRLIGRQEHTGGMVALVPSAADASRLAIPGWEPSSVLHVTLAFLGGEWTLQEQERFVTIGQSIAEQLSGPVAGNVWAAASLNPTGPDPCAAYLVGGSGLAIARSWTSAGFMGESIPEQHQPWVPHITIGYGLAVGQLDQFGPVTFDRVRVAFGESNTVDFSL